MRSFRKKNLEGFCLSLMGCLIIYEHKKNLNKSFVVVVVC